MGMGSSAVSELTAGEIPNILKSLGWTPRALDENTWRCTQSTSAGKVRVVVRHAGTWLYLVVMPFLEPESVKPWGRGKYPPRFLGRILAVNHNLVLVKFALDDEGDITLRVELPTESLQRREVETSAMLLLQTTEQYRGPIRDALLAAGEAAAPSPEPGVQRPTDTPDEGFGQPTTEPATIPPPEDAAKTEEAQQERERRLRAVTLDEHNQSEMNKPVRPSAAPPEAKPEGKPEAPPNDTPAATTEASADDRTEPKPGTAPETTPAETSTADTPST